MSFVLGQPLDEESDGEFKDLPDVGDSVLRQRHAEVRLDGGHEHVVVAEGVAATLKNA